MFVKISEMVSLLIKVTLDGAHIGVCLCYIFAQLYHLLVIPSRNDINNLKIQQEILYETMVELKSIVKIDKTIMDELTNKQEILYETINELHAAVKMDKSIIELEFKNLQIDMDYVFKRIGRKHNASKIDINDSE